MLLLGSVTAQESIFDQYKYAVVGSKFDFVRQVDGYKTSSFTKFLFEKMGFTVYLNNDEYPNELAMNPCSAIYADVRDDSSFLTTRNYIEIKDCKGRLLFSSLKGSSRLKQYEKAYRASIRKAFESVEKVGYTYDPTLAKSNRVVYTEPKEVVQKESETVAKKVTEIPKVVAKPAKVEKEVKTAEVKKQPVMVTQEVTAKTTKVQKQTKKVADVEVLYAQPNENGYQLVNTKPAIVFILLKTSNADKFFIKDKNGTFTKDGEYWVAEYYEKGQLVTQKFQVKF